MGARPLGNPDAVALPRAELSTPGRGYPFGVRLHRYSTDAHSGRNAGRLALAAELPASVLADLTGISISTAESWSQWARRDWAAYVGQRVAYDREDTGSRIPASH